MLNPMKKSILERIAAYNVRWETPSEGSKESMPLGSGVVALNVWVEADGWVHLLIARSDCFSENGQLMKAGKAAVRFLRDGNPVQNLGTHTLVLEEGSQQIRFEGEEPIELELWVDPDHPVIYLDGRAVFDFTMECRVELMRPERRAYDGREIIAVQGLEKEEPAPMIEADEWVDIGDAGVCWLHENRYSVWEQNLRHQEIGGWVEHGDDPLLGRIFGGMVSGDGFEKGEEGQLVSLEGIQHTLCIAVMTTHGESRADWGEQTLGFLKEGMGRVEESRSARNQWWSDLWTRSTFFAEGSEEGRALTRGYLYQKFVTAAAGRGPFPIKFNGSLFTAAWGHEEHPYNADYRRWGGGYWFQNTRLIYWAMLPMGMREFIEPYFRLYREALPLAEYRCREYFGHAGAFFPETMTFWGGYLNTNYGYPEEREGLMKGIPLNRYIRTYFVGILELLLLALEANKYSPDDRFLESTIRPFARAFLEFYTRHYGRDEIGKLLIYPAEALETYQDAKNPAPEIAGLKRLIPELLDFGVAKDAEEADQWSDLLASLPELPSDGKQLLPAEAIYEEAKNIENPELYAVFPFGLFGLGKPGLELARRTFERRAFKRELGWHQDPIQAALLGLTETAFPSAVKCLTSPYEKARFPGFWGPNYDWIPDQDQGSVGLTAVHTMLLQFGEDAVRIFPAWPKTEDCDFRLFGPGGRVVVGCLKEGVAEWSLHPADSETTAILNCLESPHR